MCVSCGVVWCRVTLLVALVLCSGDSSRRGRRFCRSCETNQSSFLFSTPAAFICCLCCHACRMCREREQQNNVTFSCGIIVCSVFFFLFATARFPLIFVSTAVSRSRVLLLRCAAYRTVTRWRTIRAGAFARTSSSTRSCGRTPSGGRTSVTTGSCGTSTTTART